MTDRILTLSIGSGRTPAEVYEEWENRAAIRQHDGGQSRAEAERGAVEDAEQWLKEKRNG